MINNKKGAFATDAKLRGRIRPEVPVPVVKRPVPTLSIESGNWVKDICYNPLLILTVTKVTD